MESQHIDCKSLRLVSGKTADWPALAADCVCFANAAGGRLLIGIEDGCVEPPANQVIDPSLPDMIRKRVGERTVNVQVAPQMVTAGNGGQYIELAIPRAVGVASTSDGRYFLRIGDTCEPVVGDDVLRLLDERPGLPWESMATAVARESADPAKRGDLLRRLRESDRVKQDVKEKSDAELLVHFGLADGDHLTNLGVLIVGSARDRARLGTAPLVQAIKYDGQGDKVNKWSWDDYGLSPVELVDAIWQTVPDFRESHELPDGLYRQHVPAYDERVVRELLVNALVHRPYTQRGDIYLNLHPDRLEVVNPGRLPLGVTPRNILHQSRRRNDRLATLFHDLKLMEKEGSGYDLMYDVQLSQGRPVPEASEGPDWVKVTVRRRVLKPGIIRLLSEAEQRYQLNRRERITLGLLAMSEGMRSRQLLDALELDVAELLSSWLGRLVEIGLVQSRGKTSATLYFVDPAWLKDSGVSLPTTLKRIEPHRLQELVREDLRRHPDSAIGQIRERIGPEIGRSQLKRALGHLVASGAIVLLGTRAGARYRLGPVS
jgi:ATP-dependent DNA helicase RecG